MNKKFLSVILFSALMVGTAGTFTSCKDYDDDIKDLQGQVDGLAGDVKKATRRFDDFRYYSRQLNLREGCKN